jgi:hypothetical protein
MSSKIAQLEREIELTEGWFDRLMGREEKKPETSERDEYKFSKVGPNLYVGPKPPRFIDGTIKSGFGAPYMAKTLSGVQHERDYNAIKSSGVIYGLADSEDLTREAEELGAREIKSGPGWGFDDNEKTNPAALSKSEMESVLDPLKHAAEAIHRDMKSKPTLVTCVMGQNRSASAAALALVLDGMEPASAIDQVRSAAANHIRRGQAIRNELFQNYIMVQTPGGPLVPASEIPIEKLVGEKNLSEFYLRSIIRESLRINRRRAQR